MKQTKIDWCDCTLNPVKGCSNGCEYCYARKLNDRFHFVKDWNKPEFFPEVLEQLKSKKPKSIFMDSMSDIGLWEKDWLDKTIEAMQQNRQHRYIFLSKCKWGYINQKFIFGLDEVLFFGLSVTKVSDLNKLNHTYFDFISIEPLLEDLQLDKYIDYPISIKQVIIGAETGNRKNKVIPKKEWVDSIASFCDKHKLRVFMKESLREIMGKDFRQDKLLWDTNKEASNED